MDDIKILSPKYEGLLFYKSIIEVSLNILVTKLFHQQTNTTPDVKLTFFFKKNSTIRVIWLVSHTLTFNEHMCDNQ